MTDPKDTIPGMTWFSNANASASSVPTNLFAALSDPTDAHSLEELRAHLEDGGDMEPETTGRKVNREARTALRSLRDHCMKIGYNTAAASLYVRMVALGEIDAWASERSGGDGA